MIRCKHSDWASVQGHSSIWLGPLILSRAARIKAEQRHGGGWGGGVGVAGGSQKCIVENFKGEHRVHTAMRLRQQGDAHIDSSEKRGGRTENT